MAKGRDSSHRLRRHTVAFRMSDAEKGELDRRIALSGLQRQEYLIKCSLERPVVVVGNRSLFRKMDAELAGIRGELERISGSEGASEEALLRVRLVAEMLSSFSEAFAPAP